MKLEDHNYRTKLNRRIATGELAIERGAMQNVDILHDTWCGVYAGKRCNCDPDIHLRPVAEA